MSRFLFCYLIILSLTAVSGCSKKNDFYYNKRHTPIMNPGGEAFSSDPEFVKNYNLYLKNNSKRNGNISVGKISPPSNKSNQSTDENVFLDVKNIYELPNATILPLIPFEPPGLERGGYSDLAPPPFVNQAPSRTPSKPHRASLLGFLKKRQKPHAYPPQIRVPNNYNSHNNYPTNSDYDYDYDYEDECDSEEDLPIHNDYVENYNHINEPPRYRAYRPQYHKNPKPVIPENTTGSPFLKKWHPRENRP